MASLSFYQKKHGKRLGRIIYRKKQNVYRRKNRAKINARQRERYGALIEGRTPIPVISSALIKIPTTKVSRHLRSRKRVLAQTRLSGRPYVNLAQLGLDGGRDYVRELVRIRDKRTCQECGKKWRKGMRRLDVHHLDEMQEGTSHRKGSIPMDRKSIGKMITLCHRCHLNLDSVREKMRRTSVHS